MATQTNNFILLEKDPSSPIRGQQRSVDAADDLVLSPASVALAPTGNVTLNSTSGSIGIGSSASTQPINIGTAGARIVTLGQGIGTGPTIILNGVTNTTTFEGFGALGIGSNYTSAETITLGSAAGGSLGYQRDIYIGSTNSTSSTNLYAGTGGLNLNGQINLSSTTNALNISSSSGSILIDSTTSGNILIGNSGGTGNITIGSVVSSRLISISNASSGAIFIGNDGSATGAIAIAGSSATGARTITIGTGGTGAKTVNIGESTVATSTV